MVAVARAAETMGAVVIDLTYFSSQHTQSVSRFHVAVLARCAVPGYCKRIAFTGSQEKVLLYAMLPRVQIVVAATSRVELRMRAAFQNSAPLHDHDLIGTANGRQPVRDDERGPSLHQIRKTLLDHVLRLGIEA